MVAEDLEPHWQDMYMKMETTIHWWVVLSHGELLFDKANHGSSWGSLD